MVPERSPMFYLVYSAYQVRKGHDGPWWQRVQKKNTSPKSENTPDTWHNIAKKKTLKNYQRVPDGIMFTCCWKKNVPEWEKLRIIIQVYDMDEKEDEHMKPAKKKLNNFVKL